MGSKKTIQIDTNCCGMKSLKGYCPRPLEIASTYLSKKWNLSIIITIGNFKKLRFNNLLKRLESATPKILSQRLKELEKEGILKRKLFKNIPPKVEYSLTKKGESLLSSLKPLIKWAEKNEK